MEVRPHDDERMTATAENRAANPIKDGKSAPLSPVEEDTDDVARESENPILVGDSNSNSLRGGPGTMATFPLPQVGNVRATSASSSTSNSTSLRASMATRFFSATTNATKKIRFYRGTSYESESDSSEQKQSTHLRRLYRQRMRQEKFIEKSMRHLSAVYDDGHATPSEEDQETLRLSEVNQHTRELTDKMKQMTLLLRDWTEAVGDDREKFKTPLEVRLRNFSYCVRAQPGAGKIRTVFNSSFLYSIKKLYKKYWLREVQANETPTTKVILDDINLVLEPGKNYLVLGPPQCGKTSLLRAISGRIRPSRRRRQNRKQEITGQILYNGISMDERDEHFHIQNAVQYIDQLDRHSPRLTVAETFEFAFQCKAGGTMFRETEWCNEKQLEVLKKYDSENFRVRATLIGLGLEEVSNTFVGDTNIRGVSGGQRRRVTVGEMLQERVLVLCGDEISTGLDATSTYNMVDLLLHLRSDENTRIISLLQPSPETVSLFDEVIVMSEGRIIYAGPITQVESYFASLGYRCPEHMDVADFLQQVSSMDANQLYDPSPEIKEKFPEAPSITDLARLFKESDCGRQIIEKLKSPSPYIWKETKEECGTQDCTTVSRIADLHAVKQRYANSTFKNTQLIFRRFLVLWTRDKRVIVAGAAKNILMGVSVGGVFANNMNAVDLSGALFQAGLFIMLSAMQNASSLVVDRPIFFKHYESNFYSAVPFVLGRTLSTIPQTISDVVLFGTLLYYIIGLGGRDDAPNFFIYITVLICFAFTMQQQLAVFASFSSSSTLQVLSAITLMFFLLFGGYIVAPDIIPGYYSWAYWMNPFAWAYRSLIVNEFRSGRWEDPDATLIQLGFTLPRGTPFGDEWIGWSYLYMGVYFVVATLACALGLAFSRERVESKILQLDDKTDWKSTRPSHDIQVPFVPVTLSFYDICYDVTASTGSEKLRLLHSINGIFQPGRMCALMGSSGAGKTTLMDVIAIRKQTGEVAGEVRVNGWPQDVISFRRCSGYVEQFDVQSPELTIRETVLFSARLRLEPGALDDEDQLHAFIDQVLAAVNLTEIEHALVGSSDEGVCISFEQKKLLSIAVELAASPSLVFLDEPTSGLDSRSALTVMKTLRRIASDGNGSTEGRTIVATIHQPSSTVFEMFDDLLLLKKGGRVVYHGELGSSSSTMVNYFHSLGAPRIAYGENPANWMLQIMSLDKMQDLDERWLSSDEFAALKRRLASIYTNRPDDAKKIVYENEFAATWRQRLDLVTSRLRLIYWRSPAYNLARITVSGVIAVVLGSVFILKRTQSVYSETDMRAQLSVIFLAFVISGIMAILTVLPVMTKIRDMYYRHSASGMYDSMSIGLALGSAEKIFIVMSCVIFVTLYLATSGTHAAINKGLVGFWGFFTFNFAIYSYFGQAFVCLVKPTATAIILSSVFIGLNNFFAGLIVRPQLMVGTFYALPYYICPGHYVYEGLVTTIFRPNDSGVVVANEGSAFWDALNCTEGQSEPCVGPVYQYIQVFFGGEFSDDHVARNALILGGILTMTRLSTWLALKYVK
ncbi:hypothetical protein ACA910_012870 [Epithemia clementina (nom. ined.)]